MLVRSTYSPVRMEGDDETQAVPLLTRMLPAVPAAFRPVPPWPTLNAVVKPPSEVMSEFAPDLAALRFPRAVVASVAPVPPLATTTVPVTFEAVPLTLPLMVLENVLVPAIVCDELRST